MTHSHFTQWIEDADARQFCQAVSWQLEPTTASRGLYLGDTILKMPGRFRYAAVQALRPIGALANRFTKRPV